MCCQVQHPTAVAPPVSTHARLTRVCDVDGRSLPPRGLTALLSLEVFNLLNPTLFSLYPTYMERRVVPGRPLHRHGHSASWPWASSPQTLGENQCMAGQASGAAHPRHQEGGHFSKGRGLLLIFCQRPHAHMLFPSQGSEIYQKVQPGIKEIWDPLRVQGRLWASAAVQHLTSGSKYLLYIVQCKMGCHGDTDFQSCWRHLDIYSLSALMSSWYLNLLGLKIPA